MLPAFSYSEFSGRSAIYELIFFLRSTMKEVYNLSQSGILSDDESTQLKASRAGEREEGKSESTDETLPPERVWN